MNEFRSYEISFPTLAREFFSVKETAWEPSDELRYRIVAWGYDKFINIGEVPRTTVRVFLYFICSKYLVIWPVVVAGGPYQATVYPDAQVEWMYYLRRRSVAD